MLDSVRRRSPRENSAVGPTGQVRVCIYFDNFGRGGGATRGFVSMDGSKPCACTSASSRFSGGRERELSEGDLATASAAHGHRQRQQVDGAICYAAWRYPTQPLKYLSDLIDFES
jgi:hypothetical protein